MNPEWRLDALCLVFHDLPWIEEPDTRTANDEAAMAQVCAACPVASSCEAYVDEHAIRVGFWAGRAREPVTADEGAAA